MGKVKKVVICPSMSNNVKYLEFQIIFISLF